MTAPRPFPAAPAPDRREAGATLMETLVALAITALLAAAVAQTTGFGLTTMDRVGAASARGAAALAARREAADALSRIDAGADAFAGDPAAVVWRGVLPDDAGGWRSGRWRWSGAGLAACPAAAGAPCDEPVAFGPPAPVFAFAGADGLWRDDWPEGPAPRLIRISGGEGAPAAIIVSPRIYGAQR